MASKSKHSVESIKKKLSAKYVCFSLREVARVLEIDYQTLRGWSTKAPKKYEVCKAHIISSAHKCLNETGREKVAINLLSKIAQQDFGVDKDTNITVNNNLLENSFGWKDDEKEK